MPKECQLPPDRTPWNLYMLGRIHWIPYCSTFTPINIDESIYSQVSGDMISNCRAQFGRISFEDIQPPLNLGFSGAKAEQSDRRSDLNLGTIKKITGGDKFKPKFYSKNIGKPFINHSPTFLPMVNCSQSKYSKINKYKNKPFKTSKHKKLYR